MRAPFVWLFVCIASGILLGTELHASPWLLVVAVFAAALGLRSTKYALAVCAQAVLVVLVGWHMCTLQNVRYENELRSWIRDREMQTIRLTGYVKNTPEISDEFFSMNVQVEALSDEPLEGNVRVTVSGRAEAYPTVGDKIETFARLRLPLNFRTEGSFDYERYLRKEGIHALASVKNSKLLHITGHKSSIRSVISRLRLVLIQKLIRSFDSEEGGIVRALWLDDRSGLSQQMQLTMIDAGVFHVIAISGFHVAVVIAILFFLLKRFVRYRIALVVVTLLLVFYFLLLEGRSSITRSVITFFIVAFAAWRREKIEWISIFFLSALVQLVLNPQELFDAGYHLTYLSTGAILFVAAPICKQVRFPRKIYQYLLNFFITAISVQLVLAPYQAVVFHKIPFASIVANCVAIPISSALIGIGVFILPAITNGSLLVALLEKLLRSFISSSSLFAGIWLHVIPVSSAWIVFVFYGCLIGAIVPWNRILRAVSVSGCSVSLALLLTNPFPAKHGDFLRVHILDVGQGDAILLEYPDGTYDLVDGGGFFNPEALDTGVAVLIPYLAQLNVRELQRVFLTHAHADHMNGLITLLKYVPVQEFYLTRQPVGDPGFQRLLKETMVLPRTICRHHTFQQSDVSIKVLAPVDAGNTMKVANDDSLVLLVEFAGRRLLLTGDMEAPTESLLRYESDLKVDFIKVPHHGSKSSSTAEFLEVIRPKAAFVSVGKNNWFGHPNPDVIARYRKGHALIYRTDQLGTIRLTITREEAFVDAYSWQK